MTELQVIVGDGDVTMTGLSTSAARWVRGHVARSAPHLRHRGWSGTIGFVHDPVRLKAYCGAAEGSGQRVPLFGPTYYLKTTVGAEQHYVAAPVDGQAPSHAVIRGDDPMRIEVVTADAENTMLSMHVLRDVVRSHHLDAGALFLHCSAVLGPRGGCVFVGPKAAGKTTTALRAAMHGYAIVSTDKAVIDNQDEDVVVSGSADPARIGVGTAEALRLAIDELLPRLSRRQEPRSQLNREGRDFGSIVKYELTNAELADECGLDTADSGPVTGLVVLGDGDDEDIAAVGSASAAAGLLERELLHPDPKFHFPFAPKALSHADAVARLHGILPRLHVLHLTTPPTQQPSERVLLRVLELAT